MKQILLITLGLSAFLFADFSKTSGVVTDSRTMLQWQDDYSDNGGTMKTAIWTGAIDYCESLSLGGDEWRLPNKKELLSVVDYTRYSPSISTIFEHTTSNPYWLSTIYANGASRAWLVSFLNGYTFRSAKSSHYYVRCVR